MLSSTPSTQVITDNMRNNKELKNDVTNKELNIQRRVCRIPFEEYMSLWMKTATTNPEVLMRREFLIRYTERFASPFGSNDSETHHLIQAQRTCNTPVQNLPNQDLKRKQTRVEDMRRQCIQCKLHAVQSPRSDDPSDYRFCSGPRLAGTLEARNG